MVASSTASLGGHSTSSSSPRASSKGSACDGCQDTNQDVSTQSKTPSSCKSFQASASAALSMDLQVRKGNQASSSKTAAANGRPSEPAKRRMQVPAGVLEDFEPYTWLSDSSIAFATSCLTEHQGSSASSALRLPKSALIMDPAMAFWFTMQEDPGCIAEVKTELKLSELELLLCPINDSQNACIADAGSHWSLLVCWGRRPSGVQHRTSHQCSLSNFVYYDTLRDVFGERAQGLSQARELASRIAGKPVEVEMGRCAQQTNFYDCGVYVLLFCEMVAKAYAESLRAAAGSKTSKNLSPLLWEERLSSVTPEEITACRSHYYEIARNASQN